MNEQITKLIEQLAQKLGTTSEYLWGVLIKQANIEIIKYFIILALTIIGSIITMVLIKYTSKYWKEEDAPPIAWFALVFGIIFGLFSFIGMTSSFVEIGNIIDAIGNPEYFALQQILKTISSCH